MKIYFKNKTSVEVTEFEFGHIKAELEKKILIGFITFCDKDEKPYLTINVSEITYIN